MENVPFLLLLCAAFSCAFLADTRQNKEGDMQLIQKYLGNYYGFKKDGEAFIWKSNSPMTQKIKEMQEFFGLEVTGKLDFGTSDLVQKRCCGFPDVAEFSTFTGEPKWAKQVLTYGILNYTPDLHLADGNAAIKKVLSVWSSVTPLKFITKDRGDAGIMISFAARGEALRNHYELLPSYCLHGSGHNDFIPFDGPGGSVASAYAPGKDFGGDALFNEDETWTKITEGTNLVYVAVHEFGHSVGLFHSRDPNALMYPVCRKFHPSVFPLNQDYINGIQYLYGNEFWVVRGDTILPGYPQKIYTLGFSKDVTQIDANANEGKAYYLIVDKFWRKPLLVRDAFPGISGKIDAVLQHKNFLYFFHGRNQFEFDLDKKRVTCLLKANFWFQC